MRPPRCDVCDLDGRDHDGLRLVTFADHRPLPDHVVGHPEGVHWLCQDHAAALADRTHLPWSTALVTLASSAPPVPAAAPTPADASPELSISIDAQWPDGDGTAGVTSQGQSLLWWHRPGGPGGRFGEAGRLQSPDDYRDAGPAVACPADVEARLDRLLGRRQRPPTPT